MKSFCWLLFFIFFSPGIPAQQFITRSIKDFGAKGDGRTSDHEAFARAAAFFNKRKGNGRLILPKGVYIVGLQKFTGKKSGSNAYTGEYALALYDCTNLTIEGKPGAVLKNADSLRIGTFSPADGEPFRHNMADINVRAEYAKYATGAGVSIFASGCKNVRISGLSMDGNVDGFIFGGNWGSGRNAYELIHYGIYILDSHDISINDCNIRDFACDGIYIANLGQQVKTYNISINRCRVNYCGRNGLSWLGGENIRVTNSVFSNQGRGLVQESPGAGIDIEVENNSFCRKGYFYNCIMENNTGSAITSGSKSLAGDVVFKNCVAASPGYYAVFVDAASHRFENCNFYGTVLVWYEGKQVDDGVSFRNCRFEDRYRKQNMYDGAYLLGVEGSGVRIDSCIFRAYGTSAYFLNGHANGCNEDEPKRLLVTNSSFTSLAGSGFKLGEGIAGLARQTLFRNNRFYAHPGTRFLNEPGPACKADGGNNTFLVTGPK